MPRGDWIATDPVRAFLKQLTSERRVGLVPLSRAIERNRAYFQQYFNSDRPRPRFLPRDVRIALGRYFGVDPERFRHPDDRSEPPPPLSEGPDRSLMHRAFAMARSVVGDRPEHEWLRIEVASTVLPFLERQEAGQPIVVDANETVRLLQLFVHRIRSHYGEPTA